MGKRKVTILETAVAAVAEIALYIEGRGLPQTAKKFVDNAFKFFEHLSDDIMEHKPCTNDLWKDLDYRCVTYIYRFDCLFFVHFLTSPS